MNSEIIQQRLFIEGIFLRYGYDFRHYSEASLSRRLDAVLRKTGTSDLLGVLREALGSSEYFSFILPLLTIGTTEPFRDPSFFRSLRENVIPVLKTYPHINIWIAGCSTGEEVYSLAILLKEEGLLNRVTIYASDINPEALKIAKAGIYHSDVIKSFTKNYTEAGGTESPSDYYSADFGTARFDSSLVENVVFVEHNLVTDGVFVESQLILCRNVLIYFNRELQDRVIKLFSQSLGHKAFLSLGTKESIRFSQSASEFEEVDAPQRIFRKKGLGVANV